LTRIGYLTGGGLVAGLAGTIGAHQKNVDRDCIEQWFSTFCAISPVVVQSRLLSYYVQVKSIRIVVLENTSLINQ